jgi:RNA polymerase sigma-70 factor (ECF subfamily)
MTNHPPPLAVNWTLMPGSSQPAPDPLAAELFRKSGGEKYGLTAQQFAEILQAIALKYAATDLRQFYSSLHVEELALARACAAGNELAWESFLMRYREKLYDAARAIAREDALAHELADSLYGNLFGTATREGRRVSKLDSYMGRGSLEGWLRTVLAQEFVNRYRSQRRLVSLDEQAEDGAQFAAASAEPAPPLDARLESATDEALAALPPQDRYVLAAYYLDGRTLAEVARSLGVHESTISRKLDKLAGTLRAAIKAGLVRRGMGRRQAEEAMEVDVRDLSLDIRSRLAQESGGPTFSKQSAVRPAQMKEPRS